MSLYKSTNSLFAQATWLLEQINEAEKPIAQYASNTAFLLVFEQMLIALVLEIEESNENPTSLMPWVMDRETENWLVLSLRKDIGDSSHWLNAWHKERKHLVQMPSSSQAASSGLIASSRENSQFERYSDWLSEFNELMTQCRELNSQY
jgi:hypothetical protein